MNKEIKNVVTSFTLVLGVTMASALVYSGSTSATKIERVAIRDLPEDLLARQAMQMLILKELLAEQENPKEIATGTESLPPRSGANTDTGTGDVKPLSAPPVNKHEDYVVVENITKDTAVSQPDTVTVSTEDAQAEALAEQMAAAQAIAQKEAEAAQKAAQEVAAKRAAEKAAADARKSSAS